MYKCQHLLVYYIQIFNLPYFRSHILFAFFRIGKLCHRAGNICEPADITNGPGTPATEYAAVSNTIYNLRGAAGQVGGALMGRQLLRSRSLLGQRGAGMITYNPASNIRECTV